LINIIYQIINTRSRSVLSASSIHAIGVPLKKIEDLSTLPHPWRITPILDNPPVALNVDA